MRLCIFSLIISLITAHADIISTKSWHKQVPQGIEDLEAIQERLRSLLPQTKAALVSIEAMDGAGSGVIVSEDGLVLTAAHVIGTTGKKMFVRLPDGKRAPAVSLGGSEISDAGMLQITKKKKWPFVQMAASNTSEVGDWCFGLGHPGGFDKKRGIVVRIGKVIANRDETMQTDGPTWRRLCGPLFDFEGRLIAIHSRVFSYPIKIFMCRLIAFMPTGIFSKIRISLPMKKCRLEVFSA